MQAFEIHTYKDKKWHIDSVFDDRELSLFEARRVVENGRYASVKVVQENYDEASGLTTTRTIFRAGASKQNAKDSEGSRAPKAPPARPRGTGKEPLRKGRPKKEKKQQSNLLVPMLALLLIVMMGITALLAIQVLGLNK